MLRLCSHAPWLCVTWVLLGTLQLGCDVGSGTPECTPDPCPPLQVCDTQLEQCVDRDDNIPASALTGAIAMAVAENGQVMVATRARLEGVEVPVLGLFDEVEGVFRFQRPGAGEQSNLGLDLARFSDGRPALVYYDPTQRAVRFAFIDDELNTWRVEDVQDGIRGENVEPDVFIDASDVPHVTFRESLGDDRRGLLRYAVRQRKVWRPETVDDGRDLETQILPEEACPPEQRTLTQRGVGRGSHVIVQNNTGASTPLIVYHDEDCGTLRLARRSESGWALSVIDGWNPDQFAARGPTQEPQNNVGRFNSVAINPQLQRVAVAYFDASAGTLKFAQREGDVFTIETVDDGVVEQSDGRTRKHFVGQRPVLTFTPSGSANIVYMDATVRRVRRAERQEDLRWRIFDGGEIEGEGFWSAASVVEVDNRPLLHVLNFSSVQPLSQAGVVTPLGFERIDLGLIDEQE